jgi:hypothetical protein
MSDQDSRRSTTGYACTLGVGVVSWMSVKQKYVADSTTEAEYVAASKELAWLSKFLMELGVVPDKVIPIMLFFDNSGALANSKEPRYTKCLRHVERKFHLVREIEARGDIVVTKIASSQNLADPFTKALPANVFEVYMDRLGVRRMSDWS